MHKPLIVKSRFLLLSLLLPAVLGACNLTSDNLLAQASPDASSAYQTVTARLVEATLSAATPLPSALASTSAATFTPTNELAATAALPKPVSAMSSTAPALACNLVSPGQPIDVTIPDGTTLNPNEVFSKTWRLVNSGSCAWTRDYAVVWFSGEPMGNTNMQQFLLDEVRPGQSVDVTVDMTAPGQAGSYQSNWKLRDPKGNLFGLGPAGNSPFWVQIEVINTGTPTPTVQPSGEPTLAVYANGVVSLALNDGLDLDTGELNRPGEDDLHYGLTSQSQPQFMPENGAAFSVFGAHEPLESDCQNATLATGPLPLQDLKEAVYLCYRTSQGLPGFAHLLKPSATETLVTIDFVTWTGP